MKWINISSYQISNPKRIEDGISDSGEYDSKKDDDKTEPVDATISGIIARFFKRIRMIGRTAHAGTWPGDVGPKQKIINNVTSNDNIVGNGRA